MWFLFAVYICVESLRLPLGSWRDPGPGFLPLGSGIILGVLSLASYLRDRRSKSKEVREAFYFKERWKKLISVLLALFAYAVFLEILGFLLSTFLLLTFLFRGIEPQRWIVAIGGSALTSFISYAIFELWLKTQLPKGILGF
ncbi:MAG: tripartite tricarboxylate transporter TctB family protein [Pseudomonadota bacterium]